MICVNGFICDRKEVMEIPSHQRESDGLTDEEVIDDKYVITFSEYLLLVRH